MNQRPVDPVFVEMVGGGSHKANQRLERDLKTLQIRATFIGPYVPQTGNPYGSLRVVYRVLTDDVPKARKLGMTIRKGR